MQLHGKNWFVKTNGVFRGPFDADTVRSMRNRNRIDPSSEISDDRVNWNPAHQFPELFPESEPIPNGEDETPSEISSNQTRYFYNDNGNQMGPVSFARLQELANSGRIRSTDLIWYEGAKGWHPASEIKELRFLTDATVTKNWLSQNKPIVAFASFALMILILIPAGYVVSLALSRQNAIDEARNRADRLVTYYTDRAADLQERMQELHNEEIEMISKAADSEIARKRHAEIQEEKRLTRLEQIKTNQKLDESKILTQKLIDESRENTKAKRELVEEQKKGNRINQDRLYEQRETNNINRKIEEELKEGNRKPIW
ncbi:MAG: GYF domain-containing protein [Planctomycetota bacterium]